MGERRNRGLSANTCCVSGMYRSGPQTMVRNAPLPQATRVVYAGVGHALH